MLITINFGAVASMAKVYISRGLPLDEQALRSELNAVWDAIRVTGGQLPGGERST